ncbi:MAG: xylulokinase [Caldilineaceae bacterium]|nr:xylulokinase [Caldilineaceae bacterium]
MPGTYILAHDLGTSGNKATLFDGAGHLVGSAFAAYATHYPHPNWAEQEPAAWWQAVCATTHQLLADSGIDAAAIAAVGFSGMMMGCLPVAADGTPLRSCIIWADQRAQEEAAFVAERCGADEVYLRCGHRTSPAYCAPKILWVRNHQPEIYARTAKFLVPKDFIVHKLTGEFATDYSDASGTLLFDLVTRTWHQPFLDALGLSAEQLPAPHPSPAIIGTVTAAAAAATGLAPGTPVVIGGGDGSCAGIGAGVIEPGSAYCVIGTSAWISASTPAPVPDPQQRTMTFHHVHPQRYAPMGVQQLAGGAREWAWKALADGDLDLDAAAATVAPGAGGLLFLPYLMGERSPWWNPQARGAFVGLAMPHDKPQMARAVLEGVAFGLRQILDSLREHVPDIDALRLIGGGGKSRLWPQILADVFGLPIHMLELKGEATSWGAAVAAGVGAGIYDWSIAAERSQVVAVVEPNPANRQRYDELLNLFTESYLALAPVYARLARIGE